VYFIIEDDYDHIVVQVQGGDVRPTVIARVGAQQVIKSIALDDVRGILYMMSSGYLLTDFRIHAASVTTSAARRRERLQRLALIFRLSELGRADYVGHHPGGFFEALRASWGGADSLAVKLSKQGAYWSKWAQDRRFDRILHLLVDVSRRCPDIIPLISRFVF